MAPKQVTLGRTLAIAPGTPNHHIWMKTNHSKSALLRLSQNQKIP